MMNHINSVIALYLSKKGEIQEDDGSFVIKVESDEDLWVTVHLLPTNDGWSIVHITIEHDDSEKDSKSWSRWSRVAEWTGNHPITQMSEVINIFSEFWDKKADEIIELIVGYNAA